MKIFNFVKKFIFKYKSSLIVFLFFSIIGWLMSIIVPYITGNYIDLLLQSKDFKVIYDFTAKIVLIGIITIISSFVMNYTYVKIQTKSMTDLNFYVLDHVTKLPILYFKGVDSAYLNQRINFDSNTVVSFVLANMLDILTNALTIIFLAYISMRINAKLTLELMALIPLYILLYFVFRKPLYIRGYELKEKQNEFFSKMNDNLQNVKVIKLNATFKEERERLNSAFEKMFNSLLRYTKVSYLFNSSNSMVTTIARVIIFFVGGMEIINGNLTIGDFTIISSYFSMMIGSVGYFLNLGKSYQDALISYDRLRQILDEPQEINGTIRLEGIETIELRNVSFAYDNSKKIIHDFNYEFEKGKIYCIVGDNGAGKSTLINVILGILVNYYSGEIYYNSIEIKELDMYYIRRKIIGVTEQEPKLVNDTIINNLIYGVEVYDYKTIDKLLKDLNVDIDKFHEGLNTKLNEASSNISGGEKLKIAIARTFLKDPDVIVLDEPTSALDVVSIEKLKSMLTALKKEKIILIVTHNQEFLNIADEVIDLNRISKKVEYLV
ncbi:ABC transporter ATP-binding protein [Caldanaerobacter subterraneus]|uniref:ATP-binding cassette subfamily C protein n=1 Tax=Caldanaerobacter subterraneus TaxID=911092 RepID=A0A4R2JQS5_9THEO|nr:ABC transporter ATP-binding protein [Caldanaerobacter subterraneus]TCO59159.1 ATP-binding cassette subfamily C protein [Caldanaerobacter subterraneus]